MNVPHAPLKPNRLSPTMIDGKIIVFGPDELGSFGDEKMQHMYILDCLAAVGGCHPRERELLLENSGK